MTALRTLAAAHVRLIVFALVAMALAFAISVMPATALAEGEGDIVCPDGFTLNTTAAACVEDVVDACPDANNPGIQGVGATCHVPEPEIADLQPVAAPDPAVSQEHEPDLGSALAQPKDGAMKVMAVAGAAAAPATGSGVTTAAAPTSDLPFTGGSADLLLTFAFLALLLGTFAFADARRATILGSSDAS